MPREYVESFEDGDLIVDVYKDEDGFIMEANYTDDSEDTVDISGDFGGEG